MKRNFYLLLIGLFCVQIAVGQDISKLIVKDTAIIIRQNKKTERRWGDFGFGLGLDYGGLVGVKFTFYPISHMGIFAAGGWELIGLGWNVGCLGRLFPANGKRALRPYLKVMYGVNGVTKVVGKSSYDKMFYGFTTGIGLETRFGRRKKSGINIDLNIPFRSPKFYDQVYTMEHDPEITMKNSILPITISLGYQFEF